MEQPTLPIELVSSTLQHLIRSYGVVPGGIGRIFELRLVSKDINAEVERIMFVEAILDIEHFRQSDCLQCHRMVRAERPNKALNKATCLRYMVALFGIRDLPKWDMRIKQWTVMKQAIRELELVPGFVDKVLQVDARISKEATTVLSFHEPRGSTATRQHAVARAFADALVTLLGVRNTWANFGPHHDSCGSQDWTKPRSVNFWKLVLACHVGELGPVREVLRYLPFEQIAKVLKESRSKPKEYKRYAEHIADYLTAGLTVSVRQGHTDVIDFLLGRPVAETELVLITKKYFNKSSLLYAAVDTTNHSDTAVARVAARVVDRILDLWGTGVFGPEAYETVQKERILMEITPVAPNLFRKAVKQVFGTGRNVLSKQHLAETALVGDVNKAKVLLKYLPNTPDQLRNMSSAQSTLDWSNEFGVGLDRVLKRCNIFTAAAAAGQIDMLRLFKEKEIMQALHGVMYTKDTMKKDNVASMRQWRGWNSLHETDGSNQRIHPIRDAVNDVFVKKDRLPGKKFRPNPPAEALRILLEIAPKGTCWGAETVACAGLSRPEYLQELLKVVKLDDVFPDRFQGPHPSELPATLDGAKAITIGQRALQHAVRNVKAENVRLLLEHGAKLAEGVRFANPIFEIDEELMHERDLLRKILDSHAATREGAAKMAWTSRTLTLDYFEPGQESVSAEDVLQIEKDNKHYKWQVGNKSRGRGRSTTFLVHREQRPGQDSSA